MDQIKIGKFIKEKRKDLGLTQEDLAKKLNVTNKSISKWENGKCMPDVSLIEPLCNELDITINDLLNGEVVDKKDYEQKLELNLIESLKNNKEILEKKNKVIGGLLFSIIFSLIVIVSLFLIQIKDEINDNSYEKNSYYKEVISCYNNQERINNISKIIQKYYEMNSFDKEKLSEELYNNYIFNNPLIKNNYQEIDNVKIKLDMYVKMLEITFKRDKENNIEEIDTILYAKMFLSDICYQNDFTDDFNQSSNELLRIYDILDFAIIYIYIFALTMVISYFMINIEFKVNKKYLINITKLLLTIIGIVLLKEVLLLLLSKFEYDLMNKIPYYSYLGDYTRLILSKDINNLIEIFISIIKETSIFIIISLVLNIIFNLVLKKLKLLIKKF